LNFHHLLQGFYLSDLAILLILPSCFKDAVFVCATRFQAGGAGLAGGRFAAPSYGNFCWVHISRWFSLLQ
jgi:hypothetical protein